MRQSWLIDAELMGGHVHITIRCGMKDDARAKAGDIVVREDEWPNLREALASGFAELGAALDIAGARQIGWNDDLRLEVIERNVE